MGTDFHGWGFGRMLPVGLGGFPAVRAGARAGGVQGGLVPRFLFFVSPSLFLPSTLSLLLSPPYGGVGWFRLRGELSGSIL